jgi:hypothetical protein
MRPVRSQLVTVTVQVAGVSLPSSAETV